jgi:hypothetical protein
MVGYQASHDANAVEDEQDVDGFRLRESEDIAAVCSKLNQIKSNQQDIPDGENEMREGAGTHVEKGEIHAPKCEKHANPE